MEYHFRLHEHQKDIKVIYTHKFHNLNEMKKQFSEILIHTRKNKTI